MPARTFTSIGSPNNKIAFTGKDDIGRALAQLSILAMSRTARYTVPDHVRIGGTQKSFVDIKKIFEALSEEGDKEIKIKEVGVQEYREEVRKDFLGGNKDPSKHLRYAIALVHADYYRHSYVLQNPFRREKTRLFEG